MTCFSYFSLFNYSIYLEIFYKFSFLCSMLFSKIAFLSFKCSVILSSLNFPRKYYLSFAAALAFSNFLFFFSKYSY